MIASFSVIPVDKGVSLSPYIAQVLEIVEASGLKYHTDAMGTVVEGDLDAVLDLIKKCHQRLRTESGRVFTNIQLDDREGSFGQMEGKVRSVEKILGHSLH